MFLLVNLLLISPFMQTLDNSYTYVKMCAAEDRPATEDVSKKYYAHTDNNISSHDSKDAALTERWRMAELTLTTENICYIKFPFNFSFNFHFKLVYVYLYITNAVTYFFQVLTLASVKDGLTYAKNTAIQTHSQYKNTNTDPRCRNKNIWTVKMNEWSERIGPNKLKHVKQHGILRLTSYILFKLSFIFFYCILSVY